MLGIICLGIMVMDDNNPAAVHVVPSWSNHENDDAVAKDALQRIIIIDTLVIAR